MTANRGRSGCWSATRCSAGSSWRRCDRWHELGELDARGRLGRRAPGRTRWSAYFDEHDDARHRARTRAARPTAARRASDGDGAARRLAGASGRSSTTPPATTTGGSAPRSTSAASDEAGEAVVRVTERRGMRLTLVRLRDALVAQRLEQGPAGRVQIAAAPGRRSGSARGSPRAARTRRRSAWPRPHTPRARPGRGRGPSRPDGRDAAAVVAATSEVSRRRRMQVRIAATSLSARQASAQAVVAVAAWRAASMQETSASGSSARSGWLLSISATVMPQRYPARAASHLRVRRGRDGRRARRHRVNAGPGRGRSGRVRCTGARGCPLRLDGAAI